MYATTKEGIHVPVLRKLCNDQAFNAKHISYAYIYGMYLYMYSLIGPYIGIVQNMAFLYSYILMSTYIQKAWCNVQVTEIMDLIYTPAQLLFILWPWIAWFLRRCGGSRRARVCIQ